MSYRVKFSKNLLSFRRHLMRKGELSILARLTTTKGFHHNAKVNSHRFRVSIASTLRLSAGECSKDFRRCDQNRRDSRADWDASKNDRRKRQRRDRSRSQWL